MPDNRAFVRFKAPRLGHRSEIWSARENHPSHGEANRLSSMILLGSTIGKTSIASAIAGATTFGPSNATVDSKRLKKSLRKLNSQVTLYCY